MMNNKVIEICYINSPYCKDKDLDLSFGEIVEKFYPKEVVFKRCDECIERTKRKIKQFKDIQRNYKIRAQNELLDSYVKIRLTGGTKLKSDQLPKSLIELKRVLIKIERKIGEMI